MNTNNSFLQAIKILIKESINSAPYNRTKQAMIVNNNGDNTYDIRFDGKLYTNIISYPNTRSLPLKYIVKVIIPNNQTSQMYISAEGSPLIYYPVGSYYETSDTTFDPNSAWGGTWVKDSAGRVTVAQDTAQTEFDTIGGTGGDKNIQEHTHGFTNPKIPNHVHTMAHTHGTNNSNFNSYLIYNHNVTNAGVTERSVASSTGNYKALCVNNANTDYTYATHTGASSSANTGNPTSLDSTTSGTVNAVSGLPTGQTTGTSGNLQPYIVVNRWHRTA